MQAGYSRSGVAGLPNLALAANPEVAVGPVEIGPVSTFVGADIDCFGAPGVTSVVVPALGAGKIWVLNIAVFIVVARTGTITAGPALKAGTNVAHDNFASLTTTSAANLSNAAAGYRSAFTPSVPASGSVLAPDLATPMTLELVTAATGTATLVIRPVFVGSVVLYP